MNKRSKETKLITIYSPEIGENHIRHFHSGENRSDTTCSDEEKSLPKKRQLWHLLV